MPTKPRPARVVQLLIFGALISHILLSFAKLADQSLKHYLDEAHDDAPDVPYVPMSMLGYINSGNLERYSCENLTHYSGLSIQQSFPVHDDIIEIAMSLEQHPAILYPARDPLLSEEEALRRIWAQFAMSSVWLEDQEVYLAVSRVIFYPSGSVEAPNISFLRGQLFNSEWQELRNHTIVWQGQSTTFPLVFDIPAPYAPGEAFFGPEDPRLIVEEGVRGAEPVIIFNMVSDLGARAREMHAYRPFSGAFTVLLMEDKFVRAGVEKNWAPFFYSASNYAGGLGLARSPEHFLHFIYSFLPLKILKCNLLSGFCSSVYEDQEPERHKENHGRMSGGTQLVPIDSNSYGSASFVGFSRTRVREGCEKHAMYRPELMIMTGSKLGFHMDYISTPIDFKDLGMPAAARADPCGEGAFLLPYSVARWQRKTDVLELTFSVDDILSQVIRIKGIDRHAKAVRAQRPFNADQYHLPNPWGIIGQDVVGCSVISAQEYTKEIALASLISGIDWRTERRERARNMREMEEVAQRQKEKERQEKESAEKKESQEREAEAEKEDQAKRLREEKVNEAEKEEQAKLLREEDAKREDKQREERKSEEKSKKEEEQKMKLEEQEVLKFEPADRPQ